jgi:nucleoid-associated protein YgaU
MAEEKDKFSPKFQREVPKAWKQQEVKILGEHKVAEGETLSHIALKFYGNASREYWMVIYEFNKGVIGDNPGMIRIGTELKIPELPANLKK